MSAAAMLTTVAATLVAGGVGAVLRAGAARRAPRVGTLLVNLVGTALLALVLVAHRRGAVTDAAAIVLGAGLAGSLTTFSGWIALLAEGWTAHPLRTVVLDLALPLLVAVGLTVAAFAVLA